ncbi:MAG: hypothetical protein PHQ66_01150 [Candidatus Nanoarchaeia archaeon]|nr:hypothetical protein [Candidatus Nanoarchaeia archaeon]MDD5358015.1 hypothetical protein [Candidatus Nanoarchaeia archaeon]MDD5588934.1 hypothetical protein [Candidatus Nanoarchaeia archaeon]
MAFNFLYNLFKKKIYCQYCGVKIDGGFVANNGRVYCRNNDASCLIEVSRNSSLKFDYQTSEEIQKGIGKKTITHFGKLEKSLKKE